MFVEGRGLGIELWNDAGVSHLISDTSAEDLLFFARGAGLPAFWLRGGPVPHYELTEFWRRRAVAHGAQDCAGHDRAGEYRRAMARFLATVAEERRARRAAARRSA